MTNNFNPIDIYGMGGGISGCHIQIVEGPGGCMLSVVPTVIQLPQALGYVSSNPPSPSAPIPDIVQPKREPGVIEASNNDCENNQRLGNCVPQIPTSNAEPLTPRGVKKTEDDEGNKHNAVKEERKDEAEIVVTTKDLLHLHPRSKKRTYNKVPEARKDAKYHENRIKNVEAARKSREKKRMIEEGRVAKIKELTDKVESMENMMKQFEAEKKKRIELERQCDMYKRIVENTFATNPLASTLTPTRKYNDPALLKAQTMNDDENDDVFKDDNNLIRNI